MDAVSAAMGQEQSDHSPFGLFRFLTEREKEASKRNKAQYKGKTHHISLSAPLSDRSKKNTAIAVAKTVVS